MERCENERTRKGISINIHLEILFVLTKHFRDNLIFYIVMKFEAGLAGKKICIPLLVLHF